jgi:thioesterase domain-containing protein
LEKKVLDVAALQKFLHEHIPLSKAMEVEVLDATTMGVKLSAPLAPNINHRRTVFGGSASALAILSAWALIYLRLEDENLKRRVVIQRSNMTYERPMTGSFTASSAITDEAAWRRFVSTLKRKDRARIKISSVLHCNGERAGKLEGDFVGLAISK